MFYKDVHQSPFRNLSQSLPRRQNLERSPHYCAISHYIPYYWVLHDPCASSIIHRIIVTSPPIKQFLSGSFLAFTACTIFFLLKENSGYNGLIATGYWYTKPQVREMSLCGSAALPSQTTVAQSNKRFSLLQLCVCRFVACQTFRLKCRIFNENLASIAANDWLYDSDDWETSSWWLSLCLMKCTFTYPLAWIEVFNPTYFIECYSLLSVSGP